MRDRFSIGNLSTLIRKDKGESIMRKKVLLTTVIGTSLLLAACSNHTVSVKNEAVTLQSTIEETKATEEETEDEMVMTTAAQVVEETTAVTEETTAAESGELKAYQQDCFDGIKYDYGYDGDENRIPLSKSFRDYLKSIGWDISVYYVPNEAGDIVGHECRDEWAFRLTVNDENITEDMLYDIMRHVGDEFGITVTDDSFDWRHHVDDNPYHAIDNMDEFIEAPKVMQAWGDNGAIFVADDFMYAGLINLPSNDSRYAMLFSIDNDGTPYAETDFIY